MSPLDEHGTRAAYRKGCRCNACRAGNTARLGELRKRRKLKTPAEIPHGLGGYQNYGCRCEVCCQTHHEYLCGPEYREIARRYRKSVKGYAAMTRSRSRRTETRDRAGNHGKEWTGPELEIASREDLTTMQVAHTLGRTYDAAYMIRRKLREKDPRKRTLRDGPGRL